LVGLVGLLHMPPESVSGKFPSDALGPADAEKPLVPAGVAPFWYLVVLDTTFVCGEKEGEGGREGAINAIFY
jgi:hypothetical protein